MVAARHRSPTACAGLSPLAPRAPSEVMCNGWLCDRALMSDPVRGCHWPQTHPRYEMRVSLLSLASFLGTLFFSSFSASVGTNHVEIARAM